MKKILIALMVCVAGFAFTPMTAEAATLHAILLTDTQAKNIEESVKSDLRNFEREVDKISSYSDLELNKMIFKEKNANSKFIQAVEGADIGEDDVVLFYWSGHGFRTHGKDSEANLWPSFSFNNENVGMDLEDIAQYIESKMPRLVIVLADTCNNYVPECWAPPMIHLNAKGEFIASKAQHELLKRNYRFLFVESRGLVMGAGAHPGQYSWCTWSGGFFTHSFLEALRMETKPKKKPTWDSVMQVAQQNMKRYAPPEEQLPVINVSASR